MFLSPRTFVSKPFAKLFSFPFRFSTDGVPIYSPTINTRLSLFPITRDVCRLEGACFLMYVWMMNENVKNATRSFESRNCLVSRRIKRKITLAEPFRLSRRRPTCGRRGVGGPRSRRPAKRRGRPLRKDDARGIGRVVWTPKHGGGTLLAGSVGNTAAVFTIRRLLSWPSTENRYRKIVFFRSKKPRPFSRFTVSPVFPFLRTNVNTTGPVSGVCVRATGTMRPDKGLAFITRVPTDMTRPVRTGRI